MEYNAVFNLFYSADGKSLVIMFRISAGYQHDAYCRTGVYLQDFFIQIACCHSFKQFHQVTLDAQHDTFRFRVAHAYIVFNDHRFAFYINQAEEDKAFIVDAFCCQSFYCGADDTFFHFFHPCFVGKRNRRYTTHTTGVQPFVAFADAFVVFCFGQNLVVLSIGQNEYGTFYTAQEFFNHYGGGSVTEHSAQHFFQFFLGFFQGGQNQYAFSGAKTVGFQYVWSFQCFQKG